MSNPMFKSRVMENIVFDSKPMTVSGTVNKTLFLCLLAVLTAFGTWSLCARGYTDKASLLMLTSSVASLFLAFMTAFRPNISYITAPAFALCEGVIAGVASFMYNSLYDGIIVNAVSITFLTLFVMLFLYKTKIIRVTETLRTVIKVSTFAICIFYLAGFVGSLLGHPMTIFNGGMTGVVVSFVFCGVAAFNFILDFDFIEEASSRNFPDYFEWYSAFGVLMTVIWLYFEILRLLSQLYRRN